MGRLWPRTSCGSEKRLCGTCISRICAMPALVPALVLALALALVVMLALVLVLASVVALYQAIRVVRDHVCSTCVSVLDEAMCLYVSRRRPPSTSRVQTHTKHLLLHPGREPLWGEP